MPCEVGTPRFRAGAVWPCAKLAITKNAATAKAGAHFHFMLGLYQSAIIGSATRLAHNFLAATSTLALPEPRERKYSVSRISSKWTPDSELKTYTPKLTYGSGELASLGSRISCVSGSFSIAENAGSVFTSFMDA